MCPQDPASTYAEAIAELASELRHAAVTFTRLGIACEPERAGGEEATTTAARLHAAMAAGLEGHFAIELLDAAGIIACATDAAARLAPATP